MNRYVAPAAAAMGVTVSADAEVRYVDRAAATGLEFTTTSRESHPDILQILADWGPCPTGGRCESEFVFDGMIDVQDLLAVLQFWGAHSWCD